MDMDEKESMSMVIRVIETDSMDRVEDILGRLIDLFNSSESREFLDSKKQKARSGLLELENAMEYSLFEGMKAMRQLVTEVHIHLWSGDSAISRFQFNGQSLYYLLTRASDVLKNDSLSNKEKVQDIWDGITKSVAEDEDREKARRRLDEFLDGWRRACKLPDKKRIENQIKRDFDNGLKKQHSDIENLFSKLRTHFEGLRSKLQQTKDEIADAEVRYTATGAVGVAGTTTPIVIVFLLPALANPAAPATVPLLLGAAAIGGIAAIAGGIRGRNSVHEEVVRRGGERFLHRKKSSWYPRIENSLFDYIRGNMADDELQKLLHDERLEEDLDHIREHLQGWISSCRALLDKTTIPVLNKEAFIVEAKRTWAFAKALLLGDSECIQYHNELLTKLTNIALSSSDHVAPFISVARLPDGSQALKLKLIARQNADWQAVYALVCDLAEAAGGNVQCLSQSLAENGTFGYEISFGEAGGIRQFIAAIAKQTGKLAEVHVRVALLGEYDVNIGARLTNPAYNRIYGDGLSAPGFRPTVFGYLDYSGEKYHCPSGWRRISINVAKSAAAFDQKYGGWHVAYHGTKHELAATILTTGLVPSKGAYSDGSAAFYFSPSIEYAGHPRYAKVYDLDDKNGRRKYIQMVLQVRVNPSNIWKKVGGTIPGAYDPQNRHYNTRRDNPPADPNFPKNRNLEWLVKPIPGTSGLDMFKDMFVIYGIMIRVSDTDPENNPANAWWMKK